jgi:bifunctional DNA-binding transcriptional regulator/antitoxin component of YhaV-PrlF toxin-antitoxin module
VAKVTSKLQVTIPRALATAYGIEPGDDIEWSASGDAIRVSPAAKTRELDVKARLQLFDQATRRQRDREKATKLPRGGSDRGWTREELYDRGRSR